MADGTGAVPRRRGPTLQLYLVRFRERGQLHSEERLVWTLRLVVSAREAPVAVPAVVRAPLGARERGEQ
jgi:hypothetical protein